MHYDGHRNSIEPRILGKFYTADLSEDQYKENQKVALDKYKSGEQPTYSSGICDSLTAGYGRLDYYDYWEYPLPVNQKTQKILVE